MMRLARSEVVTQDEVHPYIDNGLVTVLGDSPNATVKLLIPDETKYVPVDTFRHCTIERDGETIKITGQSDYVLHVIGDPQNELTILVSPGPECENCP
jgi:hypothetical protein